MASGIVEVFAKAGYDVMYVGRTADKVDGVRATVERSLDKAIQRGKLPETDKAGILARLTGTVARRPRRSTSSSRRSPRT